jgi:hypothetical protein
LYERLLSSHQLVKIGRTVFIIASVPNHAGKPFLDQLFSDIAAGRVRKGPGESKSLSNPHILISKADGSRFALLVLAFARADKVDMHPNLLANQLFPEEFTGFLSVVRLFGV